MLHEQNSSEQTEDAAEPAPSFDTLPDVARKFRAMAGDIHADAFHLFAIAPRSERSRLIACLDSDYPGISESTRDFVFRLPRLFAETAVESSRVLCWAGTGATMPRIEGLRWCEKLAITRAPAGLALPVSSEGGQQGVVIFAGENIAVKSDALLDIHARCFPLFAVVVSLHPVSANQSPAMSRRELECLNLTAEGLTSEEIAKKLGLSVHTANQYLINTTQKLNAVNRVHAVAKALRAGLID